MRVGIVSLGCAKNLINSEQMMYLLKDAGFEVTGETDGVDAVVLNTCGFIESAKMEAIETILELGESKRQGRFKKLIVTGCLAQRYKSEIFDELPEIDGAVGVGSFADIVNAVQSVMEDGEKPALFGDINAPVDETPRMITTSPVSAYLKIAEGCDNRCAFCAIPDIRGKFRSRAMENIVQEARDLAAQGIKELIVVAQDSTRYGVDLYGKRRLSELLEALCNIDELKWIRLHYLYPSEIDDKLIDTIAKNGKILKYMDIPIQHINDGVLKKMRRRGSGNETRELLRNLREKIPGVVIRTSVITGLPGEGEAEFEALCEFLTEAKIERAGVFPYSPEDGTAAESMARTDANTAAHRAELVAGVQARIMDEFNRSRIGSVTSVLIEGHNGVHYYGRSYAESPEVDGCVLVLGEGIEINDFAEVRITGIEDGDPIGKLL
ncbi:MAG: 30S ribosomal protein S12 methylthiotransferase RimO [Oscillospiraceae bacterium]|nr:30S ribosomal protein S12 methylthiotransferase RimO [Oscillospiraceae bacterium]